MMKHVFSFVCLGLGAAALGGCPIYSGNEHSSCSDPYASGSCDDLSCYADADCASGYSCDGTHHCRFTNGAQPGPASCTKPSDCPSGSSCGADNRCHAGDCSASGCPSNFVCKLKNGAPTCEAIGNTGALSTCSNDKDCSTPGAKCLSGTCVNAENQCADATQCAAGSQCVAGECTPSCSASKACPTGYSCDLAKGVCTGNAGSCTSSTQCKGGTVCVQEHCVNVCSAGAACPAGLVCVDGGCTPDEKPVFTCTTDGAQDKCQAGSLCLRHSCYISCDTQVVDSCKSADKFNVCKSVTTISGPHSVCGSDANLGADCDPTQAKNCAGQLVCIDGFCR